MGETAGVGGEGLKTLGECCVVGQLTQPRWPVFVDPKHACVVYVVCLCYQCVVGCCGGGCHCRNDEEVIR